MQEEKRYIKLTKEEEIKLETGRKTGKKATFRERCHYILLSAQGKSVLEIADIFKVTRQTITRWFDRYDEAKIEGLHTAKGQGREPIIRLDNEAEISTIEDLVEESPQNLKPVLAKIEEQLGKKMSKRTLQRLLEKKMDVEAFSKRNT
jgi:transposase